MLTHLRIVHYALIEELDIDFQSGYSVITGETGAGKSILLGALGLLCGERAEIKAIQRGEKKCFIEATFNDLSTVLKAYLQELELDEDDEIIIRREITTAGKSRAFVNDTPVSLTTLRQIGVLLIDIHSQHQNLLLREESFLLDLLDTIGGNSKTREEYAGNFSLYLTTKAELAALREKAERHSSEADYLQFQLEQLDAANLAAGEEEELEKEVELLNHAEEIKSGLYNAHHLLADDDSIISKLKYVSTILNNIAGAYAPAGDLAERVASASIELKDIAAEADGALDNIDFDPQRLAFANERLQTIYDLKKKHRVESEEQLITFADELREKLSLAQNSDELIAQKEKTLAELEKQLTALAAKLHSTRLKAGKTICETAEAFLKNLGMPHSSISFELHEKKTFQAIGTDNATLLFSANKNVPPANLADIASGGESARVMLALKAIIARHKELPTIIFDEIDTGVSGHIAEKMAHTMHEMAEHCQVICVTHLPQIAAAGAQHYKVYKEDGALSTTTHIKCLTSDERIEEISKMLSGENITDAAISNAKALLAGNLN